MTITEIAIKRSTLVVVIFSILAILGLISYSKLNYDLIPKLKFPVISVVSVYPGASANEIESSVTKVLEDALSSLEKVKSMSSTSTEGVASIIIELESDADVDNIVQNAQRKLNAIAGTLPIGAKTPSNNKFSSDELPIMKLSLTGNLPDSKLYTLVDNQIRPLLSKIGGVGQVTLVGGNKREIKIQFVKADLTLTKSALARFMPQSTVPIWKCLPAKSKEIRKLTP